MHARDARVLENVANMRCARFPINVPVQTLRAAAAAENFRVHMHMRALALATARTPYACIIYG